MRFASLAVAAARIYKMRRLAGLADEAAASLIEYAITLAVISAGTILALTLLGGHAASAIGSAASGFSS